jgi:uncharacterized protein (TIGR00661 family)
MRILYGLCGEGKGHATRSLVAIRHLTARGHEVLAAGSGQAFPLLAKNHPRSLEIIGLSMSCAGGELDLGGSVELNLQKLPEMLVRNSDAWSEAERFQPQAVISDFDSFSWLFAAAKSLPLVSFDNAQILPRCVHDPRLLARHPDGFSALDTFVRSKAPSAHHYIVTSFFFPPVRPECAANTTLIAPVLRESVLRVLSRADPRIGGSADQRSGTEGPALVYKTASLPDDVFLQALSDVRASFVVYGCSERATLPPNCIRRPFSEDGFIRDLASCSAVIGNAGMSLIGEALAFGKPVYGVPVKGQFEQVLNAEYLTLLRYGMGAETLEPNALAHFLKRAPELAANVRERPQHDENRRLYRTLDGLFG